MAKRKSALRLSGAALDAAIAAEGEMPLPPYIAGKRKADAQDAADYQTVFARAGRLGGRAHRGPAFHAGTVRRAGRAKA